MQNHWDPIQHKEQLAQTTQGEAVCEYSKYPEKGVNGLLY